MNDSDRTRGQWGRQLAGIAVDVNETTLPGVWNEVVDARERRVMKVVQMGRAVVAPPIRALVVVESDPDDVTSQ